MPSRTYTNADANRQYGKGRTEFGSWMRPLSGRVDPYAGLEDTPDIDSVIRDAKDTYRRTAGRGAGVVDETLRRLDYDRAEESARRKSNPLTSLVTSVFSPEQRESVARRIEGDSRNKEGVWPRLRSFAAGAVGGAGEGSEWGGAMGEISPLNVATGFGVTKNLPAISAVRGMSRAAQRVARRSTPRSWAQGMEELGDIAVPSYNPPTSGVTDGGGMARNRGGFMSWLRGNGDQTGKTLDPRKALDPNTWSGVPDRPAPVRRAADVPPTRDDGSRLASQLGLGRLRPRETPTVEEALTDALEAARAPQQPTRVSMPTAAEVVPRSGTASGAESLARRAEQASRAPQPTLNEWELMDDPVLSVVDDIPTPQAATADPNEMASFLNRFMNLRGAGPRRALAGEAPPAAVTPTPDAPVPSLRDVFAGERPMQRGGGQLAPQTDPARLLPAFGETAEGMAPQRLGIGRPTRTLRPEATTMQLANELAQSQLGPGARVKSLKSYLRPEGSDELSKALRQRAHIADSGAKRQGIGSEAGQIDPALLGFAARTGGGALVGSAKPEWVGADEGEHVEGGVKGGLLGAVAPSIARGLGRIAKAVPQGLRPLGRQIIDEVQNLRYMGALSGRAIPKSIAGNIGAPFIAAAERGTTAPIREFFNPRTVRTWLRELRNPTVDAHTMEQQASPNLFGRILGAGDVATTEALERVPGISGEDAARYLLRTPTGKLGFTGPVDKVLKSRLGKAGLMFQTTPLNQAVHGASAVAGVNAPQGVSPNRMRALAGLAATAGGAQVGLTEDFDDPLDIAMTAPLLGPYSVPYLAAAAAAKVAERGIGEAREIARGISPAPELGMDVINPKQYLRPILRPAIDTYFPEKSAGQGRTRRAKASRSRRPRQ